MNEEISKILQMVESGKINAEEAERLIRALSDAPKSGQAPPEPEPDVHTFPNPFRDLQELFRFIGDAQNRALRRQHRWLFWRHYKHSRSEREARAKRAETMDTASRIRFVLLERALIDKQDFDGGARLEDLLDVSRWCCERTNAIAWENLQYGLEDEFGLDIPMDDLKTCETVQSLVDYVESRAAAPQASKSESGDGSAAKKPKSPKTGPAAPQPAG